MDGVSFAASIAQIGDMALCVFMNLYTYYRKVHDAPKRSKELRDRLDSLLDMIEDVHEALELQGPAAPFAQKEIDRIKWWLSKAKERTTPKSTRGFRRLKWPLEEDENAYIISQIDSLKGSLDTRIGTQSLY